MTFKLILQIVGTSCGIAGVILTVFKSRFCWLAYIISNFSFIILFALSKMYIPILQYCVFIPLGVIGWVRWTKDDRKQK